MIERYPDENQNARARALKIIYCAAGGDVYVNSNQPETDVEARSLRLLSNGERPEYLQEPHRVLSFYFTPTQQRMIEIHLSGNLDLPNLRQALRRELAHLRVGIPFQII